MRASILLFLLLIFQHLFTTNAQAEANKLNYSTYYVTTYAPYLENPYYDSVAGYNSTGSNSSPNGLSTQLSTGTISGISGFNWGSSTVFTSGRSDNVAMKVDGYITWPGTAGVATTVYFGVQADDGVFMNIDGTNVIQDWQQQGPATWNSTGAITLTGGEEYPIVVWWYEWGGGAVLDINYSLIDYQTYNQANIPSSWFNTTATASTTSTSTGTSGGITTTQSTSKSGARTRANSYGSGDNTIYIDQAGNNNTIEILQDGTAGNHIQGLDGADASTITGNSNTIDIRQGADTSTGINLIEFTILGSTNDILLYQDRLDAGSEASLTGGEHTIKLDVDGNLNNIDIIQRSTYSTNGGHFVELDVTGNSNVVDLKQIGDYSKDIFGTVTGDSNDILVRQRGASNKYLEFDLIGNGHDLDVDQSGTGSHNATIILNNGSAPSTLDLTQSGSTDQSYSLEQTCYTLGGCSATVTQN
jgi:hypothetical protein